MTCRSNQYAPNRTYITAKTGAGQSFRETELSQRASSPGTAEDAPLTPKHMEKTSDVVENVYVTTPTHGSRTEGMVENGAEEKVDEKVDEMDEEGVSTRL